MTPWTLTQMKVRVIDILVEGNRAMVLEVCELNKIRFTSNEASLVHCLKARQNEALMENFYARYSSRSFTLYICKR